MYSPLHFYAAFWAVMLAVIPYRGFVTLWLAVHIPYYVFTSRGRPQHTGSAGEGGRQAALQGQ